MNKLRKLFFADRWTIAYRINKDKHEHFFIDKNGSLFTFVRFPKGFWGADPFLWKDGEKIYLFCEYTCEKKSKAFIAYKEIYPVEENKWNVAYEFKGHTSYPCLFEFNGSIFMVPETTFNSDVVLLKFNKNGKKWSYYSTLCSGINAPDTTFLVYNKKPYVFIYEILDLNHRKLHLCELDSNLRTIKKDNYIKEYFLPDGRPGGNCFNLNKKNIRVIQPGINLYGEKLVFSSFDFNNGQYCENAIYEICPSDIRINRKTVLGIHTYNKIDNVEVVDLFIKGHFDLFRPLKIMFKRLRIFGYGLYDSDKIFLNKEFDNKRK